MIQPEPTAPVRDAESPPAPVRSNSLPVGAPPLPLVVKQARWSEIARRVLCQEKREHIAAEVGLSVGALTNLLNDPDFVSLYVQVQAEFYAELDKHIKDEKLAPALRAQAQAVRAQTLMGEVMEEIRERIKAGKASGTVLKTAVDLSTAILDRSPVFDQVRVQQQKKVFVEKAPSPAVNINIGSGAVGQALKEAGIDLSDVIDVTDASTS